MASTSEPGTALPPMEFHNGLESQEGVKLVVVCTIFQALAITAVGLRVWAKFIINRKFQIHDYLIFASLLFSIGFYIIIVAGGDLGAFGFHIWQVTDLNQISSALKAFYASLYIWITATTLAKLSILHLYRTVFSSPGFRKATTVISVLVGLFWASYILVAILICRPIEKNWNPLVEGECGSTVGQEIASASINMVLDAVITLAPLPLLWGLKMSKKNKLKLTGIICAGLVICAMNLARVIIEAQTATSIDITYVFIDIALFAGLEAWIGIIVACAPLIRPVFSRNDPNLKSRTRGYTYQKTGEPSAAKGSFHGASKVDRSLVSTRGDDIALSSMDESANGPPASNAGRAAYWAKAQNTPRFEHGSTNSSGQVINVETEIQVVKSLV